MTQSLIQQAKQVSQERLTHKISLPSFPQWDMPAGFLPSASTRPVADVPIRKKPPEQRWQSSKQALADGEAHQAAGTGGGELEGVATSAPVRQDKSKLAYAGSTKGQNANPDRNCWGTPATIADLAREVMGSIELDPMSIPAANENVRAERIITPGTDAFKVPWRANTIWLNPPYGRGIMSKAVVRFLDQWEQCQFQQACVLTNNATETVWFRKLSSACAAMAMLNNRVQFVPLDNQAESNNSSGQIIFYYGPRFERFARVMKEHACVFLREDFDCWDFLDALDPINYWRCGG